MVTIIKDGVKFIEPHKVFFYRNEKTETLYRMVENYRPIKKTEERTVKIEIS